MKRFDHRDWLLVLSLASVLYGVSGWSVALAWMLGGAFGLTLWVWPHVTIPKEIARRVPLDLSRFSPPAEHR